MADYSLTPTRPPVAPSVGAVSTWSKKTANGLVPIAERLSSRPKTCACCRVSLGKNWRRRDESIPQAGIDYRDFDRMQTEHRAESAYRRDSTPAWLFNDAALKEVLCGAIWRWIFLGNAGKCPPLRKNNLVELKRAADVEWSKICATRTGHTREYRAMRKAVERCGGVAQLIAKLLWLYRTGANSVAIAQETGLSATAVRQRLLRMRLLAKRLGIERQKPGMPIAPVIHYGPATRAV